MIPARDEAENLPACIRGINRELEKHKVTHEILVIDDGSTDSTQSVLTEIGQEIPELVSLYNDGENGFGRAVRLGLQEFSGDAVAIMMADLSDSPQDLVRYWQKLQEGHECVFGSRFMPGSQVIDYPKAKLVANRVVNTAIRYAFKIPCNDITNAFKIYRREVIEGCRPFISPHFNLTVEIPLKAVIRGFSWATIPISWRNRSKGVAKLKLKEMGSRYFFIVAYLWLEKYFSRGDYRRKR
ncbi:glycosyltransferase family 2 protein [Verrucomicrobia bacterium]|nr:glycosyltransferase family 2 protein [Verrucomicrobiota bacterium]